MPTDLSYKRQSMHTNRSFLTETFSKNVNKQLKLHTRQYMRTKTGEEKKLYDKIMDNKVHQRIYQSSNGEPKYKWDLVPISTWGKHHFENQNATLLRHSRHFWINHW